MQEIATCKYLKVSFIVYPFLVKPLFIGVDKWYDILRANVLFHFIFFFHFYLVLVCLFPTGELLLHFFRFYSEHIDFSFHVVTIHTLVGQPVLVADAVREAEANLTESVPHKVRTFKISSMCVQDPFELSHNVTKSLSPETFATLLEEMNRAFRIMSGLVASGVTASGQSSFQSGSFLCLFDPHTHALFPRAALKQPKLTHCMFLPLGKVASLLEKVPTVSPLVEHIGRLNTSSQHVASMVGVVVLSAIIQLLEHDLGFECAPMRDVVPPSSLPSNPYVGSPTASGTPESVFSVGSQALHAGASRKRSHDSETLSMDEDVVFMDDVTLDEPKRARTVPENEDPSFALLSQHALNAEGLLRPSCYRCTAHAKTWLKRRQLRRQMKNKESSVNQDGVRPLLSPSSSSASVRPVLEMVVSVDVAHPHQVKDAICAIKLVLVDKSFVSDFQLFFAFFKKFAFSKCTAA